MLTKTLVKNR